MLAWIRARQKALAIGALAAFGTLGVGAALFAASGVYNVAAGRSHFAVTTMLLQFVLGRSVAFHSAGIEVPPLDDDNLIRLGAAHFESGCAPCHGAPSRPNNPVVRQMMPSPPPLSEAAAEWSTQELFWIVRNGLKYTGMPAWVAHGRDDEVWAVVSFLKRLPEMDGEKYKAVASGNVTSERAGAEDIVRQGGSGRQLTICMRCHDERPGSNASNLVPRLSGQTAPYLELALTDYAKGRRSSGIMEPVAAELHADEIKALALYYARLNPKTADKPIAESAEDIDQGRNIALNGVPSTGIPACLSCHGSDRASIFPRLAGQHAAYISGQLRLWRKGLRQSTGRGAIMSVIGQRLSPQQSRQVAAYFASLPAVAAEAFRHERDLSIQRVSR